jgi:hypothetical protein
MAAATTEILRAIGRVQATADETRSAVRDELAAFAARLDTIEARIETREQSEALAAAREEGKAAALKAIGFKTTDLVTDAATAATSQADAAALRRIAVRVLRWIWPLLLAGLGLGGAEIAGGIHGGSGSKKQSTTRARKRGAVGGHGSPARLSTPDDRRHTSNPVASPAEPKK